MSIFDFFTREAGQERRRALEGLLTQFIPPEIRPQLGLLAEANPVVSMERAGQDAETLFAPDQSLMDRLAAGGRMASNMAGVVAPAVVAGRAGVPLANAVTETLTGLSMTPQAAALRDFGADEFGGVGFRAYHGSPYDFDRFSMSKIGTGEGAQAYGHGLYFAENEAVAQGYRDALAPGMGDGALRAIGISDSDLRTMRQFTQSSVDPDIALRDWLGWTGKRETPELRAAFMQEWNGRNPGRMYEVQINADPNDFIDWDKPLSAQSPVIRDAFSALGTPERLASVQGENAYRALSSNLGALDWPVGADAATRRQFYTQGAVNATERLRDAGIPGIRYLDAGSRGAGDGSRNYVVFDENLIEIVRKYGIAGAAALLGLSQADVVQAMEQQQQPQGLLVGQ